MEAQLGNKDGLVWFGLVWFGLVYFQAKTRFSSSTRSVFPPKEVESFIWKPKKEWPSGDVIDRERERERERERREVRAATLMQTAVPVRTVD